MKVCGSCGIKLTAHEMESGTCDICGASVTLARSGSGFREDTASAMTVGTPVASRTAWAWGTFRSGLLNVIIGSSLAVVGLTTLTVLLWVLGDMASRDLNVTHRFLVVTAGACLVWAMGANLTGVFLCNAIPSGTGAKRWAVLTSVAFILALGLQLTNIAVQWHADSAADWRPDRNTVRVLGITALGLFAVVGICWKMLMFQTSRAVGNPSLGAAFLVNLAAGLLAGGTFLGLTWGEVFEAQSRLVMTVAVGVGVAFLIWEVALLSMLRATVSRG